MLILAGLGCDSVSPPDPPGPPAQIVVMSGDNQTGIAGQPLTLPVVVEVRDARGTPVPGVTVNWGADEPGPANSITCGKISADRVEGMLSIKLSTTDSRGTATAQWTLPARGGECLRRVSVVTENSSGIVAERTITARITAGAAASVTVVRGLSQVGAAGSLLGDTLVALVRDAAGLPVPGTPVTWSATDGEVAQLDATTSSDGFARATWRRGSAPSGVATARAGASTASAYAAGDVQRFSGVADNNRSACATGISGGLYCWGEMTGASAIPAVTAGATTCMSPTLVPEAKCRYAPVRVADSPPLEQIALTYGVGCGLTPQGVLWCWGYTAAVDPTSISGCAAVPGGLLCSRPVHALSGVAFAEIAPAGYGICGRTAAGAVWCWGTGLFGGAVGVIPPARVDVSQPIVSLGWNTWAPNAAQSPFATAAFDAAGEAYPVGAQMPAFPGPGTADRLIHFSASGLSSYAQYARTDCRVATASKDVASCSSPVASVAPPLASPSPLPPFSLTPGGLIIAVRSDYRERGACAMGSSGAIHCAVPNAQAKEIRSPGPFSSLGGARCALHSDGTVRCRGTNQYGELGVGLQGGESYSFSVVRLP